MIGALGISLFGVFLLSSEPPDIAGQWSGEEWGQVVLKKTSDAEYTGTYTDTFGKRPGEIQLKWSRLERRFNGTWREGDDRVGEISVRLVGDEIRGAYTTDPKSKINPGTPHLVDLSWSRAKDSGPIEAAAGLKATFGPVIERVLPYGVPCRQQYLQFRSGDVYVVGNGPATTEEEFKADWKKVDDAGGVDISLGSSSGIQLVGEGCIFTHDIQDLHWDTFTAEQVVKAMKRANFTYGVMEPAVKDLPVTYLFKTSRGEVGIMEILAIVEDERGFSGSSGKGQGIKFRYKLVKQPESSRSAAGAGDKAKPANTKTAAEGKAMQAGSAKPQRLHHFELHEIVTSIALSPDGKLIAVVHGNLTFPLAADSKRSMEILDAETGKTVVSFKLSTSEEDALLAATEWLPHFDVGPCAFSPDAKLIAVATGLGQVKLFNAQTGEFIRSFDDEKAKLAEKKTPEELKALKRAMGSVSSLAFTADGSLLAMSGSSFDEVARNWGPKESGGLERHVTGPGRLKLWDVKTGTLKHDLVGHSHAIAVAFSPDGNRLASAGSWEAGREHGSGVIIWDPQSGNKLRALTNNDNGGTHAVACSPDGKLLAIGSLRFDKDKEGSTGVLTLAHVATGIVEWSQIVPGGWQKLLFAPDGTSIAVLSGRQLIRFVDIETGKMLHEIQSADYPEGGRWTDFAIAPQAHSIATGGFDAKQHGIVEVWDLNGPSTARN